MTKKENKKENKKLSIKSSKKVTGIDFLKQEEGDEIIVEFKSGFTAGFMKNKPAVFTTVFDHLEENKDKQTKKYLVSSVLFNILNENYPDQSFIGKSFRITKGEKVKGKENQYNSFDVEEVEIE